MNIISLKVRDLTYIYDMKSIKYITARNKIRKA